MAIKAITTDSFRDDVLKTRKPVLVKFWRRGAGIAALLPRRWSRLKSSMRI